MESDDDEDEDEEKMGASINDYGYETQVDEGCVFTDLR